MEGGGDQERREEEEASEAAAVLELMSACQIRTPSEPHKDR